MSNNSSDTEKFGIEFVDPNDLIQFIEETNAESDEDTGAPAKPLSKLKEPQSSEDSEGNDLELVYTDKIIEEASEYIVKKQEDTRGRLAILYTFFTFFMFILGIVICVIDGLNRNVSIIDNLSVVLPLLSGIFLGTLGFVIGYYFRKNE